MMEPDKACIILVLVIMTTAAAGLLYSFTVADDPEAVMIVPTKGYGRSGG